MRPSLIAATKSWHEKRNSSLDLRSSVTVVPISSAIRGGPAEVILGVEDGMKDAWSINAHNTMTVVKERIGRRFVWTN